MINDPHADDLQAVRRPARLLTARNGLPVPGGYAYRGAGHDIGYQLAMARLRIIRAMITGRITDDPGDA
jgi:hypothetical protein